MTPPQVTAPKQWTVMALLEWTAAHCAGKGFDEARLHVELLLAHVLAVRRLDLYLQFDRVLLPEELARFKKLYERRLTHEPLQYILGFTEFMGLRLAVQPGALIPRPETELLVERALAIAKEMEGETLPMLEIGTGTGNIALAVAHGEPRARVVSVDQSSEALALARRNAEALAIVTVEFREGVLGNGFSPGDGYRLLLSNPPYVSREEFAALQPEIREFEPRSAVTDEGDGLSLYPLLASCARSCLAPGGVVLVEVGHGQAGAVREIFGGAGLQEIRCHADYAGIDRVVEGRR